MAGGRGQEIIKTPGSESNVKNLRQMLGLRASGEDLVIFNQFDELGNYLWHYSVTGPAMHEVLKRELGPKTSTGAWPRPPARRAPSPAATA